MYSIYLSVSIYIYMTIVRKVYTVIVTILCSAQSAILKYAKHFYAASAAVHWKLHALVSMEVYSY